MEHMKRENFIPDVIWARRPDGWMVPLSRAENSEEWLGIVDDDVVVTQTDDGKKSSSPLRGIET